jgi:pimeloyl-ACP methyl ester carboxylesterase
VHTFALRATDARRFRLGLALWRVHAGRDHAQARRDPRAPPPPPRATVVAEEHARLEADLLAEIDSPAAFERLHRQNECMLESCTAFAVAPGDLAGHDGRVLIVESDDDPAIRRARPRPPARHVPAGQVRTFHGTGHVTARAAPEAFAEAVESFLGAAETVSR